MLERADRWLIEEVFEPVAHFSERGFGISNFTLARFFMILLPVTDATVFWQLDGFRYLFYLLLGLFIAFVRFMTLAHTEGVTGANVEKHLTFMMFWRMICVGLTLTLAGIAVMEPTARQLLWLIGDAGLVLHLYFAACDRPPPLQERTWGWRQRQA